MSLNANHVNVNIARSIVKSASAEELQKLRLFNTGHSHAAFPLLLGRFEDEIRFVEYDDLNQEFITMHTHGDQRLVSLVM